MQFVLFCVATVARVAVGWCVGLISSTADGCGGFVIMGKCGIEVWLAPICHTMSLLLRNSSSRVQLVPGLMLDCRVYGWLAVHWHYLALPGGTVMVLPDASWTYACDCRTLVLDVESVFVRRMHRTKLRVVIDQEDCIHPHTHTHVFNTQTRCLPTHTHTCPYISHTLVLLVAQGPGFFCCSPVSGSSACILGLHKNLLSMQVVL